MFLWQRKGAISIIILEAYIDKFYCTWSLLSTVVLQLIIIIQTHHHLSFYFILYIFTFSIFIMFSLIPSDANDPQGLVRR